MGLETVLVAVGTGDAERYERLGEEVIDVGGPAGAVVVLVHVFTEDEYGDRLASLDIHPDADEAAPDAVAGRHTAVRDLRAMLEDAGLDTTVRGAVGDQGAEIVALAGETDADLVVVSGRRRSPTGKAVFGSTAQEVMLEAPCPVMFVREDTT